jgi:putative hydrolase of the HAD superfamily
VIPARAVSFDLGQTLASIDLAMLGRRLGERGVRAEIARLERAVGSAWSEYDRLVREGGCGHPWKEFMRALLSGGGIEADRVTELADWLFDEQPKQNLWRRPIAGMIELGRDLAHAGVAVGILTNSEGRAAELVAELGWDDVFGVVVDSGRVGIEKPDARIFHLMCERLGAAPREVVHVGDSLSADVDGALRAGMLAVWLQDRPSDAQPVDPARVRTARTAVEVREALRGFGVAVPSLNRES